MDTLIFHNDKVLPLSEASLSPGQTGLLTGWGVFTTLRLYQGIPLALERHWARMQRDAHRLGVQLSCEAAGLEKAVRHLASRNRRLEGMARVTFIRNTGGLWSGATGHPATDLLVFTRELVPWPAAHRLKLHPMGTFSAGRFAGTKTLSWLQNAAVLEKTVAEGFDEALLLNERGQLSECTSANVFLVRGTEILTPPLSSGCLPGVTREILLEIGFALREQDLTPDDLGSAEEVFLSSTTREVAPVGSIAPGKQYPAPGKVTLQVEQLFRDYVHSYLARATQG